MDKDELKRVKYLTKYKRSADNHENRARGIAHAKSFKNKALSAKKK